MPAFRIARPLEAFSTEPSRRGRKRPRAAATSHLEWIRSLPCVVTGRYGNIHAAHIRYGDAIYGKRPSGTGEKPDDKWTVPLHGDMHTDGPEAQHGENERAWWASRGIDPLRVAAALWACSGDDEQAEVILRAAREGTRK